MKSHLLKLMPTAVALVLLGTAAGAANKPAHHPPAAHHAGTKQTHHLVTVNMDLDFKPHKRSAYGKLLGYSPVEVRVHQNDQIQFVNVDDEQHTATGMSYSGQQAPAHYVFQSDFTKPHGRIINASEWGTGNVRPHGKSQVFVAKTVGNYFFGCGYHLGKGQIGVIIVGP
jgi:plastocyanin